nr:serine protease-like [Hymenolepis microstoma]
MVRVCIQNDKHSLIPAKPSTRASVYIRNVGSNTEQSEKSKRYAPICSALLIAPQYLLTAAHCLLELDGELLHKQKVGHWIPQEFYSPYEILVRFGAESSHRDHIVNRIMLYREIYQFHLNDIVLLGLSKPVQLPSGVEPIRLSPPFIMLLSGKECLAVGWERNANLSSMGKVKTVTVRQKDSVVRQIDLPDTRTRRQGH